jgi:hypothetical protein
MAAGQPAALGLREGGPPRRRLPGAAPEPRSRQFQPPQRRETHIDIWVLFPYIWAMKITVEVDEKKLFRLMKLTGIRTKTRALDYALSLAERTARRERLLESSLAPEDLDAAVDPAYDVLALRQREKPGGSR